MPQAGHYRHRITIETPTEGGKSVYGEPVLTWSPIRTVWARVTPTSGNEQELADVQLATLTHRIRIRARRDVTPRERITWKGRTFGILAVRDIEERGIELELLCREEVPVT